MIRICSFLYLVTGSAVVGYQLGSSYLSISLYIVSKDWGRFIKEFIIQLI
jgi:hypothetical protein